MFVHASILHDNLGVIIKPERACSALSLLSVRFVAFGLTLWVAIFAVLVNNIWTTLVYLLHGLLATEFLLFWVKGKAITVFVLVDETSCGDKVALRTLQLTFVDVAWQSFLIYLSLSLLRILVDVLSAVFVLDDRSYWNCYFKDFRRGFEIIMLENLGQHWAQLSVFNSTLAYFLGLAQPYFLKALLLLLVVFLPSTGHSIRH